MAKKDKQKQSGKNDAVAKTGSQAPVPKDKLALARLKQQTTIGIVDRAYLLGRAALWMACVVLCARYLYLAVAVLAGKETSVKALVQLILKMSADRWIAWAVAAICGGTAINERRLRRKTIKDMGDHAKKLEQKVDSKRLSSGLRTDGTAKKEDRDG